MVRPTELRKIVLALAEVEEKPHFDRTAFRTPARIFATLGAKGVEANVRLPPEVQQMLTESKPEAFIRLAGAWGAAGWTRMELAEVDAATCREVLKEAHAFAGAKKKTAKGLPGTKVRNARPPRRTSGK
jgi:hypothetical protein